MSDDIRKRFEFPNSLIQSQVILFVYLSIYLCFMVTNEHFWRIEIYIFNIKYFYSSMYRSIYIFF